jgi:hypothetical protein
MFPQILEDRMPNSGQRMRHGDDSSLRVRFYRGPKYKAEESRIEERDIYDDAVQLEYIEIKVPGGDTVVRVVTPADIKRFSEVYRQWQLNEGQDIGTPLDVLGFTETQKDMCTRAHVFSVEQLSKVGDHVLSAIGIGAMNMRKRANDYLDAKPSKNVEVEALKEQMAAMQKQNAELQDMLKELVKGKK